MLKSLLARLRRQKPAVGELIAAGNRAEGEGRLSEACAHYRAAIAAHPMHPPAHLNLGAALEASGDLEGAQAAYRAVLRFDPSNPYANYNLANVASARGAQDVAVELLRIALHRKPDFPEAHVALSNALDTLGQAEQALPHLEIALCQRPDYAGAWLNYGILLRTLERLDDAENALRRALELDPDASSGYRALGALLRGEGRIVEALQVYQRARARLPQALDLESAELFTLLYSDAHSEAEIFSRHRDFARRFEAANPPLPALARVDARADRPLRIGYVSGDLYRHPVALFLIPVLEHHERASFHVTCDSWRDAGRLGDAELAEVIRADGIDVLVDLAGHTGTSRLGVFARRPAAIHVSWLGYLHSTGLKALQYRLCDAYTDPPEEQHVNSEVLVRLPHSQWCYRPFLTLEAATTLPCLAKGHVTFGSFNHCAKISPSTRRQWRAILEQMPQARLVVLGVPPGRTARGLLEDLGGPAERSRITLVPRLSLEEYLRWYNEVDVALDTSPYSGGTTTCDALWMGVPVVSASGSRSVSRSSASLLRSAGLADWVAPSLAEYVALVVEKSRDTAALAELRARLRERVRRSPLMDEAGFTRGLEAAYRGMWQRWCEGHGARLV
jgi:protein O-GlcNAc transferase